MRIAKDWALAGILHPLTTMQSCSNNTCLLVQVFTYVIAVYFDEECCQQRPYLLKKVWCHVVVSSCGVRSSAPQANQCEVHTPNVPCFYKTLRGGGEAGASRKPIHFVIRPLYSLSFD